MCGISGFNWQDKSLAQKMNTCLEHRGPDAEGVFAEEGISLAHRRLAIIDLSSSANQPMTDSLEELVIVFNGEIYNYKELKNELVSEYEFKTESDTEVILAGYRLWGKKVVNHLNGIFAFAIWDRKGKELFVARDHMGVKPFYYFWDGERFIFGSEIKAVLAHSIPRALDYESFNEYLRVLYVPEPRTMIQNIYKLPPGSLLTLCGRNLAVEKYFKLEVEDRFWTYKEAREAVQETVLSSVKRQMVSDVPVGVYLSGGIDSSAVLAGASKVHKNIKTFSVGFELEEGEESEKFNRDFDLARETSTFFGADHHELVLSANDVAQHLEGIIETIDDPISNPTAITMSLLSRFAKKEVTVVLSGNGGDELFGGYERYRMSRRVDAVGSIPGAKYLLPSKIRKALDMDALDRLAQFEFEKDWRLKTVIKPEIFKEINQVKSEFKRYIQTENKTNALMLADALSWLPDQALALGDKMSMLGSLEERVPLLDRELVELAMTLPLRFKVTPFQTKKIFKDAFRDLLPSQLFKEPKRGWFSPGAKWIRRPEILSIFKQVLSPSFNEETRELFEWKALNEMLHKHVEKKEYNLTVLWAVLTFQIWARKYQIKV